jgi:hypothetical protein
MALAFPICEDPYHSPWGAGLQTKRRHGCWSWKEKGCEHHYAEITTHDDKDDVFACIVEGCGHKIRRDRIALTGGPT